MLGVAGLYVANFLTVITAVLLPIDTLSGEISSGVAQTMASKPVRRSEIVLGKWLACWLLALAYVLLTGGGVIVSVWAVSGYLSGEPGLLIPGFGRALGLMLLAATVMLTISIAGGARFSTITNGMVAFGLFGLSFLGGWVEHIGVFVVEGQSGRHLVRSIGTIISLAVPTDALWRLAAYTTVPPIIQNLPVTPFTSMYPPTDAMIVWAPRVRRRDARACVGSVRASRALTIVPGGVRQARCRAWCRARLASTARPGPRRGCDRLLPLPSARVRRAGVLVYVAPRRAHAEH